MKTKKLICTAMLTALSVIGSSFFSFPLGIAKIAPVQHLINLLSAVLLGPSYAVSQAFASSLLRNLFGTGTILAFPGSMIGALLAGLGYKHRKQLWMAMTGEIVGTGFLGSLCSYIISLLVLESSGSAWLLTISFLASSACGAVLGIVLLKLMWKQLSVLRSQLNTE